MRFNIALEEIKYIKILCKDINNNPCTIKAGMKSLNEKRIIACTKFEKEMPIQTPQEVMLSIVCSDGLYRTKTKLVSLSVEDPYVIIDLDTPQGIEYEQNREYFRVPVSYDCVYSINKNGEELKYNAKTADISASGVSIILPEHIITEEDSYLEILVAGVSISTEVKYIRSEKVEGGYRLSFTYTNISAQDRDFISKVCLQSQLEMKRKQLP